MPALLKPKPVTVKDRDGAERSYALHRFDVWDGREVILQYPVANMPKVGEYKVSAELAAKIYSYITVETAPGVHQALSTRELVGNHIPDGETGLRLEYLMMEYNYSFFAPGAISSFFGGFALTFKGWIMSTLTDLSERLSQREKQTSTTSRGHKPGTT